MSREELRKDCRIISPAEDSPSFKFGGDVLCFIILRRLVRAAVLAVTDLLTNGSKVSRVVVSSSSASSVNEEASLEAGSSRSQTVQSVLCTSGEPKMLSSSALKAQAAVPRRDRPVHCSASLNLRNGELAVLRQLAGRESGSVTYVAILLSPRRSEVEEPVSLEVRRLEIFCCAVRGDLDGSSIDSLSRFRALPPSRIFSLSDT